MTTGQILGFGLVVAFALLSVYPGQGLERRMQSTVQSDALSLAYMQAWLRAMPSDHALRLLVTRRLLARGDLPEAEQLLSPLLDKQAAVLGSFYREAQLLQLDLLIQTMWQFQAGQPAFLQAQARVKEHLERMTAYDWDEHSLRLFIREAQSAGAPEQAMPFMRRLLEDHPDAGVQMRADVIALEQAAGNPRAVAALYFQGMTTARSVGERRESFMAGLRALQSGDLMAEVPEAARHYGGVLEDDPETLMFLVRLMQQANRLDRAEYYVSRLLQQKTRARAEGQP